VIKYEMLGDVRVVTDLGATAVTAQKIELLLAVLLVRAGQPLTTDQLVEEIWPQQPPARSAATVHVYVSQLRKFLAQCTGVPSPSRGAGPLLTRASGYTLRVEPGQLDMYEFQEKVATGRVHARAGRHEQATACFGSALALWRGRALGGLRGRPIINEFVTWADEAHLDCVELLMEEELALGRHRELIARLRVLAAEHPLRENFTRQLMLALYRSQRRGEALQVYHQTRQVLVRELGLEPGRALQELHHSVLVADGGLDLLPAA
jgi:DNA-binding SARP family transcriptional activator